MQSAVSYVHKKKRPPHSLQLERCFPCSQNRSASALFACKASSLMFTNRFASTPFASRAYSPMLTKRLWVPVESQTVHCVSHLQCLQASNLSHAMFFIFLWGELPSTPKWDWNQLSVSVLPVRRTNRWDVVKEWMCSLEMHGNTVIDSLINSRASRTGSLFCWWS